MITGWGAHHIDTAHWGMDTEFTGPVEIWGTAQFPTSGLWDVHGAFRTEARYANGVELIFRETGWTECPVYDRYRIAVGARIPGPAIVEELGATTVVGPADAFTVDAQHNLVVDVRAEGAAQGA